MYYRLLLIGKNKVGKTATLTRFVDNRFPTKNQETIGADYRSVKIVVDNIKVNLQIWDTAGNEKFPKLLSTDFYRTADACLLFYDVTQLETLQSLPSHVAKIKQYMRRNDYNQCEFILVGNKADLHKQAEVTQQDIQEVSEKIQQALKLNHLPSHQLISAKTDEGVNELFEQLTARLLTNIPVSSLELKHDQPIELNKSDAEKREKNTAPKLAAFFTIAFLLVLGIIFWPIFSALATAYIALIAASAIILAISVPITTWLLADKLPACCDDQRSDTSSTQYGLERMGAQRWSDIENNESTVRVAPKASPLLSSGADDAYTLMDDPQPQTLRQS